MKIEICDDQFDALFLEELKSMKELINLPYWESDDIDKDNEAIDRVIEWYGGN